MSFDKIMKVAFVCVNYSGGSITKSYIESLVIARNDREFDMNIFVVDNSPLPDLDLMEYCNSIDTCHYIRSNLNEGYFAGLNLGLKNLAQQYDYVIVSNNDLVFDVNFCIRLKDINLHNDVQVLCPNIINLDNFHQNPHHLKPISKFKIFTFDLYFTGFYISKFVAALSQFYKVVSKRNDCTLNQKPTYVTQGVGACYILTKRFFNKHTELYFPSFLYCEEAALSWQVHSSGGKIFYDPSLLVIHHESSSLSKNSSFKNYSYAKASYWKIRHLLKEDVYE